MLQIARLLDLPAHVAQGRTYTDSQPAPSVPGAGTSARRGVTRSRVAIKQLITYSPFGGWSADEQSKVCFVLSAPAQSSPVDLFTAKFFIISLPYRSGIFFPNFRET